MRKTGIALGLLGALWVASVLTAQERPGDKGDTPVEKKLRGRPDSPRTSDIDAGATLESMLAKKDKSAFPAGKGATIEGYVIQTEREEDGDYHLTLASAANETDTRKWVIVEVTPAWQKRAPCPYPLPRCASSMGRRSGSRDGSTTSPMKTSRIRGARDGSSIRRRRSRSRNRVRSARRRRRGFP